MQIYEKFLKLPNFFSIFLFFAIHTGFEPATSRLRYVSVTTMNDSAITPEVGRKFYFRYKDTTFF